MSRKVKAWFRKNHLTEDPSDAIVVIESLGSMVPDEIIEELKKDGMELKPETVKDVITRYNNKCIDLVLQGHNVNTGLVYLHISPKGVVYNKKWDPERNSIHVTVSPSKELRETVAEVEIEIMGEHPDPMAIYSVTDLSTGKTDGTVTCKFNAEIKGSHIKIAGDNPDNGIYFRNEERQIDYKLQDVNIVVNDPSKVLILIPEDLEPGTYEMRIVTQFTGNKKTLKNARSITYFLPITVI
jgi:hypothetical protein